jgi:hypothetical protein
MMRCWGARKRGLGEEEKKGKDEPEQCSLARVFMIEFVDSR